MRCSFNYRSGDSAAQGALRESSLKSTWSTLRTLRGDGDAGCQCLPTWSYTSSKGVSYTVSNGTCQNPGGEWNTFWCYVDQVHPLAKLRWPCAAPFWKLTPLLHPLAKLRPQLHSVGVAANPAARMRERTDTRV